MPRRFFRAPDPEGAVGKAAGNGQMFDLQPDARARYVKYVDGKAVGCTKVVVLPAQ